MITRYKKEKILEKLPVTNKMAVTTMVSINICMYANIRWCFMWYRPSAYIADRKNIEPITPYKNIRGEPRGGGDSPSCMIIDEPSKSVEKRTRKSISHFSFFLSSSSGICIACTIAAFPSKLTLGHMSADEFL